MTARSPEEKRELLARLLRERQARPDTGTSSVTSATQEDAIRRLPRGGDLAPSFIQQQCWVGEQLAPESTWNLLALYSLTGPLDHETLRACIETVVRRHESLRSVFVARDGVPVQRILDAGRVELPVADLRAVAGVEQRTETRRIAAQLARAHYDLTTGPLFRTQLLRLGDAEHMLLVTFHHIISDGWSVDLFFQELATCYGALRSGRNPELPVLPVQAADFAQWQRDMLTGEALDRQRAYWKERLSGELPRFELAADHPRPLERTFDGAAHHSVVPRDLLDRLRELSRREGVTLFTTLVTAFETLLMRYTGQDEVFIGTFTAGRERPESQHLIGCFVNTLALRTDLSGDPTFLEALARSHKVVIGAQAHSEYPYEKLVADLQPSRILTGNPVLRVNINKVSLSLDAERTEAGVRFRLLPSYEMYAMVETLNLFISERKDALDLWFIRATELFEAATIERMERHFHTLLAAIAANPDRPLSTLPLLAEAERVSPVPAHGESTDVAGTDAAPFPRLFESVAERHPGAIAVADHAGTVTYAALDARANRIAHRLRELGVTPGARVGLCVPRNADLVAALLGIHKAGAAYVPIDPAYPRERRSFMVEDSEAFALIVSGGSSADSVAHDVPVLDLGNADELERCSGEHPGVAVAPTDTAYVMYTSGSTGQPKGVVIRHSGLSNYLLWASEAYDIASGAGAPVHSSIAFDLTVTSVLAVLVAGRTAFLVPESEGVEGLAAALRTARDYSLVKVTPGHLDLLREQYRIEPFTSSVRVFVIGGEQLLGESLAFWQNTMPAARFVNEYGPTETVVGCCVEVLGASDRLRGPVPIGKPIANMRMYVMGADARPLPQGLVGEIYIGGVGVGAGYLKRADLSRSAFVPDPFIADPDARLYRTGDRGRVLADGRFEYLGRMDTQVKIRGFRVEPGEIEAAIAAIPGIAAAAVIADATASGEIGLHAFYVGEGGAPPAPESVRALLRASLPEHMVPGVCTRVDALPITPNGKIDRRALKALRAPSAAEFVAPRTPVEEIIAGIWMSVLGVDRVGVHDNFFGLGGYSLLATRVIARLRETFMVDLQVRDLFEMQTVAGLATHLGAKRRLAEQAALPIGPTDRSKALALSSGQQRLWFFDQLEPGSAAYNIPAMMTLRGTLNTAAVESSLTDILRRHEALRTTFASRDGRPVATVAPPSAWVVPLTDLTHIGVASHEAAALKLAADEAAQPFDLARGPLFRAQLIRLDADLHFLLVTFHHIVADGWSFEIWLREFAELYAAYATGRAPALPPLAIQYADFAAWEQSTLAGDTPTAELAYWKDRLAGAPPAIELPLDHERPAGQTFTGGACVRVVDAALRNRLETLGRGENATPFMTILAAFGLVLGRVSGQDDVCIGVPVAGRGRTETEGLIGVFVNSVVMRIVIERGMSFRDLLSRVRETALSAYAHEDLPFDRLVEALHPERDVRRTPVFQVMFNMNTFRGPVALELPGLRIEAPPVSDADVSAKFEITLYVTDGNAGLQLGAVYNANLFSQARIEALLDEVVHVLDSIAADASADVTSASLVTRTAATVIPDPTVPLERRWTEPVHARFSRHAARAPEQAAVIDTDRTWSYGELDRESDRLANHLLARGIAKGDAVAIYAARRGELAWAMLGVLKAGAAFVIVDPAYPTARSVQSLRVAQPRAWIDVSGSPALPEALEAFLVEVGIARVNPASHGGAGAEWCTASAEPTRVPVDADDTAYIVFTSGSTGTPKGVVGTHAPLSHFFEWHSRTSSLGAPDRFSVLGGLSHDPILRDILGAFWVGAAACMPDQREFGTPGYLRRWLTAQRVTVAHITPATAMLIVENGGQEAVVLSDLRHVFFGADALSAGIVRAVRALAPQASLTNFYGASETPQAIAWYRLTSDESLPPVIPLGRGIDDVQLLVLNRAGGMAGIGELGEIHVRTPYLARGYAGDALLTAEKFIANPFGQDPSDGLYRTGDLGRYRYDGSVEFHGRRDRQIKVRGFRVELGEIEAALRSVSGAHDVAVIVEGALGDDARIIAYVAGEPTERDPRVVRSRVRERLPGYMVPAHVVMLERLPLTPNGKLDRAALPPPDGSAAAPLVAPRSELEWQIAETWTEMLGNVPFGVHDNFFELGGHSLMATRVLSRINATRGIELPVRVLFEAPTIEQLAVRVAEAARTAPAQPLEREEVVL